MHRKKLCITGGMIIKALWHKRAGVAKPWIPPITAKYLDKSGPMRDRQFTLGLSWLAALLRQGRRWLVESPELCRFRAGPAYKIKLITIQI